MAHADSIKDPHIWREMQQLSGHSLAVLTPLEDTGPWSKTAPGSDRKNWLFVGLREHSGIIDVARVEGPPNTMGVATPQDKSFQAMEVAILVGEALGSNGEARPQGRMALFLDRRIGGQNGVEDSEVTVHPMPHRATRQTALDRMDEDHVTLLGAAIRDHHRLRALVDRFEGPTRNADVRNPGTIDTLNLANGVYQNADGTIMADPNSPWATNTNDGTLQLLEIAATKGKIEPLMAAHTPLAVRGALATSLAGYAMAGLGDDPERRARIVSYINDVAGAEHIGPETRMTLATNAGWLSERTDTVDGLLATSDKPLLYTGPALKAETLAAAARMVLAVDGAVGAGSYGAQDSLVQAPISVVDRVGGHMMDMEARMGPDPIGKVAKNIQTYVVEPALLDAEARNPSLRNNPLWHKATQPEQITQRARAITVGDGMAALDNIPLQITNADDGARAIMRHHPTKEEAMERFQKASMRNPIDHTGTFQEGVLPRAARAVLDDPHQPIAKRQDAAR